MKYELLFSDLEMGHPELGWISREDCRDPDEEDHRFAVLLRKQGMLGVRVRDGNAVVAKILSPEEMDDKQLLCRLEACDPKCEHDDLHEPDGKLASYWREASSRGLLNRQ